ncbi:hypothetical protein SLS60_005695 [Paraconiothyrium brasiliense]|uniref:Heterokaryon incompatibility domain-containing protein n=1 Tax=Paraconiothyrium brasiliense TaxID=300254 RepID=A0ABR3RI38_9PLEO
MDADITLIATSPGADDGLQGVSRQARHPQDVFQLGPFCLASFTSLDEVIANSVWARRGWTFQEGCLSTRRLIFTDHGVVYMCHSMQRWETIEQEVTEEDGQNRGVITHLERILPNFKSLPPDVWWNMLVEEYTGRALSFDEDALHACLGILKALNVSHHWGVKIIEAVSFSNHKPPVMDLYWRSVKPAHRRKGFPTWSWTSCTGSKDFGSSTPFMEDVSVVEIQTDEKQGQWVNATERTRDQLAKLREVRSGQRLRVTGAFLKPVWVTENGEYHVRILAHPDKLSVFLDTTAATMVAHENTEALVIEPNYNDMSPIVMLLYPHGDHHRRFGIAQSSAPRELSMWALRHAGSRPAWMEHVKVRTVFVE